MPLLRNVGRKIPWSPLERMHELVVPCATGAESQEYYIAGAPLIEGHDVEGDWRPAFPGVDGRAPGAAGV